MPTAIHTLRYTALAAALLGASASAQLPGGDADEPPVKYAIYSAAWSSNSNAGLRVVAQNLVDEEITLVSLTFKDEKNPKHQAVVELDLAVPAHGWAEKQLPYMDLLFGNECIAETMEEDWRLVEISNYTLNPSVRGLIIENTESFRIYQCVRPIYTTWLTAGTTHQQAEWVLYHYERMPVNN
jgi:hypothetical protein